MIHDDRHDRMNADDVCSEHWSIMDTIYWGAVIVMLIVCAVLYYLA